jgi:hypothetical protein
MSIPMIFFLLLAGHALCDYPLQGDFLSRGKNHRAPIPGVPWYQCLGAHAFIHGGAVALITGNLYLGLLEVLVHALIDYFKCDGAFDFNIDQALHVFCKIAYAAFLWGMLA